jgi:hypothetical protein
MLLLNNKKDLSYFLEYNYLKVKKTTDIISSLHSNILVVMLIFYSKIS